MQRVLTVLRDYAAHEVQPTMAEIGRVLGVTAPAVHHTVSELERRGYVVRDPGRQRGIRLCAPPLGHVTTDALIAELATRGITASASPPSSMPVPIMEFQ